MGCHTWFYKKRENQPSVEFAKEYVLDKLNECLERDRRILNKEKLTERADKCFFDICNKDYKQVLEDYKHQKAEIKRMKALTDKHEILKQFVVCSFLDKGLSESDLSKFHGGFVYDCVKLPEYFRVSNYPDDVLTCYEDFEKFYLKNIDRCYSGMYDNEDDIFSSMKKFWEDYPDGIVDFG